jgi:8-oxo-dGTP pyrophosphatase MutT (NUDIX family)
MDNNLPKFSKLKPKKDKETADEVVFSGDHFSIIKYDDWSIVKSVDVIICIPVLIETNQIILRYEYIPTFKYVTGQDHHLTLVAGGIEKGEDSKTALFRELEEEAGLVIREDYVVEDMKPLFGTKGSTTKYYPFILPLNERDYHEVIAKGDGSKAEALSKAVKVDIKFIDSLNPSDIITEYMLLKVKEYLNIQKY